MSIKKHQVSLFLVALSASSAAQASTCTPGHFDPANGSACVPATPGHYVPRAGASTEIAAPPGTYINTAGATAPIPAPPGYYVPTSGSTTALIAPVGTYVPTAGSSRALTPGAGYYSLEPAATNEIAGGGVAAPLTSAIQSSAMFDTLAGNLFDKDDPNRFRLATGYEHTNVDQAGSTGFGNNIEAFALQADLLQQAPSRAGVQVSYAHNDLSGGATESGDSYEIGLYQGGRVFEGRYEAALVYGQTFYDNQRNVTATYGGASTNNETLKSSGDVSWYGLRTRGAYPLVYGFGLAGEFGLLSYQTDDVRESGTATLNGAATTPLTALSVGGLDYVSAPVELGVTYDILPKTPGQSFSPVTFEAGVVGNLARTVNLTATSTSFPSYSFDVPVTQSSAVAGLFKLSFNALQMGDGFNLSGVVAGEEGGDTSAFQVGLNLTKQF